jgi:hypothetical protein
LGKILGKKLEKITAEQLIAASPALWAYKSDIVLPNGLFRFSGREYLKEPLNGDYRLACAIKATQGGWTMLEVLKCLHGMIYRHFPQGVLYLFPTGNDVSDFSKSRFSPIIEGNSDIGCHVRDTDAVGIKKVGNSYLYLRGARLSQSVGGEKESAKLRSISVDRVVYDEFDLMEDDVRAKAIGRMGASEVRQEAFLSNPTIPDFGIDKIWQTTDQRHWMIKCEKCNSDTCLELEFPECIRFDRDGKGVRVCIKCKEPIDRCKGRWVAKHPSVKDRAGWWWSQLNSPTVDPGDIVKAFENPPGGNLADVYRLMLGMAYIEAENRLTKQDIYSCCGVEAMRNKDDGPCAMGADVGRLIHVVIAKKLINGKKQVVYLGRHSDISDLYELSRRYNVKIGCMDLYPETRMVRDFQRASKYGVWGLEYHEKQTKGVVEDQVGMVLKVSRTESMDNVHNIVSGGGVIVPHRSKEVDEYALEMTNTAKILDEDAQGNRIYRYKKLGADHYYHATNCCLTVLDRIPAARDIYDSDEESMIMADSYMVETLF